MPYCSSEIKNDICWRPIKATSANGVSQDPHQKISQAVSCKNHPPISNAPRVIRSWSSAANSVWVDLPPSIKIGVSLILVQGNEYLSKLSLPAISTLVAGRLHTADAGVLKFSFYLSAQSVRQAI
jgi:hypothetical protein